MSAVTYSLIGKLEDSDQYYSQISDFSIEVTNKIDSVALEYLDNFSTYLKKNSIGQLMPKSIYGFEFLMIGVFWNTYIHKALNLNNLIGKLLSKLVALRTKKGFKPTVDFLRGILGEFLLSNKKDKRIDSSYSLKKFNLLIKWLDASGEFSMEAERLKEWSAFFDTLESWEVKKLLTDSAQLGLWFKEKSKETLGSYTSNVSSFIEENEPKMKWKEHRVFCTRKEVEYHLNMVGAEIMNYGFREEFLSTKEKRVLLPICMRAKSYKSCKSIKTPQGYTCMSCSKDCVVSLITTLGKQHDFKVYIIPHASSTFSNMNEHEHEVGIVGVACVLNLISGGYKAKSLGFHPQCVVLDYCGCKKHWHDKGVVTRINIGRLMRILNQSLV